MRYAGSEARVLDAAERRTQEVERHAPFEVVEGGGLDARARQGVSGRFLRRFEIFMICTAALLALGAVRVAMTSATVATLQQNAALEQKISTSEDDNGELQIEHSVLSSSSRIDLIATENYGMVRPTSTDTITLGSSDQSSTTASADDAQSAQQTQAVASES
jgi:cell division protein FtsL